MMYQRRRLLLFITALSLCGHSKAASLYGAESDVGTNAESIPLDPMNSNPDSNIGAIRMGSTNLLVPDSASDHPLILSHEESMPLCNPDTHLDPINPVQVLEGYDSIIIANHIKEPRKLLVDRVNHILVMSGTSAIYSLRMDKCGNVNTELILDVNAQGQLPGGPVGQKLAHGMALDTKYLYVATVDNVYRFPYSDGQHSPLSHGRLVVRNIGGDPDAPTEAMPDVAIDPFGNAFIPRVHMGAEMNQDNAIIKKFNFRSIPKGGYDYQRDGTVHAYGTNSRGSMAFDAQARLWGADHALDNIKREDLGGDLSSSGSAEEINLYEAAGLNYGFPYCFTEFNLKDRSKKSAGLGAQWAHPKFMKDSIDDQHCQKAENNHAPAIPLAPGLKAGGLFFYMGTGCSVGDLETLGTSVGLPCNWTDTPIVAYHGANGRTPGHSVAHLPFDDLGHKPRWDKKAEIILRQIDPCTSTSCFSPVGLAVDEYGRLLVSSDTSNEIFMVRRIFNANSARVLTDRANLKEEQKEAAEEAEQEDAGTTQGGNTMPNLNEDDQDD